MITGVNLELDCRPDMLGSVFPSQPKLNDTEITVIDAEIVKLQDKGVITAAETESQYLCHQFLFARKKDGTYRMILNLKCVNKDIAYHHFKMDTLQTVLKLVTKGCFMASVDLKDVYYSVPVSEAHNKFLRFQWKRQIWQYECMPNGLSFAPRKFTKLLKPVFATLREKGHLSTAFLGDSLL